MGEPRKVASAWADLSFLRGPIDALQHGAPAADKGGYHPAAYQAGRIALAVRECQLPECDRPLCAKGLCRLHWERQYRTGTTDAPAIRRGAQVSNWKGEAATYGAVHLRMSNGPRPANCALCDTTVGRFEWALRPDTPTGLLHYSPEGYAYSANPAHYFNLCKACHNGIDLTKAVCKAGHEMTGDNVYVQPSNGKKFCRACQSRRRHERHLRDIARSARFEHGEHG